MNNGANSLHGGPNGFHRKWWEWVRLPDAEGPGVRLTYVSADGEEARRSRAPQPPRPAPTHTPLRHRARATRASCR